LAEAKKKK